VSRRSRAYGGRAHGGHAGGGGAAAAARRACRRPRRAHRRAPRRAAAARGGPGPRRRAPRPGAARAGAGAGAAVPVRCVRPDLDGGARQGRARRRPPGPASRSRQPRRALGLGRAGDGFQQDSVYGRCGRARGGPRAGLAGGRGPAVGAISGPRPCRPARRPPAQRASPPATTRPGAAVRLPARELPRRDPRRLHPAAVPHPARQDQRDGAGAAARGDAQPRRDARVLQLRGAGPQLQHGLLPGRRG
jgi:hypothetical protein